MEFLNKLVGKRKKVRQHRVLRIRNRLGTKFQLKLKILIFWTNLIQKGYFHSKKEENENHHRIIHT